MNDSPTNGATKAACPFSTSNLEESYILSGRMPASEKMTKRVPLVSSSTSDPLGAGKQTGSLCFFDDAFGAALKAWSLRAERVTIDDVRADYDSTTFHLGGAQLVEFAIRFMSAKHASRVIHPAT